MSDKLACQMCPVCVDRPDQFVIHMKYSHGITIKLEDILELMARRLCAALDAE